MLPARNVARQGTRWPTAVAVLLLATGCATSANDTGSPGHSGGTGQHRFRRGQRKRGHSRRRGRGRGRNRWSGRQERGRNRWNGRQQRDQWKRRQRRNQWKRRHDERRRRVSLASRPGHGPGPRAVHRFHRGDERRLRGVRRGRGRDQRAAVVLRLEHQLHTVGRLARDRQGQLSGRVRRLVRRLRLLQVGGQAPVRRRSAAAHSPTRCMATHRASGSTPAPAAA